MNAEREVRTAELNGVSQFEQDGFQIIKSLVEHGECDLLAEQLTTLFAQQQKSIKGKIGGLRNLLQTNSHVSKLARSAKIFSLLETVAGSSMFPVRAIFFDKNPDANWLVPWHQDLAIAVAGHIETPGFTGWSIKDKTQHVHPPQEILESMMTVRLHLDDCNASNGALKILSGTHRQGKFGAAEILKYTGNVKPVLCELSKGDALLMRPLLLHASSPADNPRHRRVLHIEYATRELPNGLKWLVC
jgi:ectoine hydroxylase-related dioxygenase (phytanoyl-CoA dioxygenase family)